MSKLPSPFVHLMAYRVGDAQHQEATMPGFVGPIAFVDQDTTEFDVHRHIESSGLRFRDLPRDARAIFTDVAGHMNAEPVGAILGWEVRAGGEVWAIGRYVDGDPAAERAANLHSQGVLNRVSVDPTDGRAEVEMVSPDGEVMEFEEGLDCMFEGGGCIMRERWTDMELGAFTFVSTPAFSDTQMRYLTDEELAVELKTFGVGPAEDGEDEAADDEAEAVAASAAESGPTVTPGPAVVRLPAIHALVAGAAVPMDRVVDGPAHDGPAARVAVTASVVEWDEGPPAEWFARLDLDGPTPFEILPTGEVRGHLACWGQCHLGFLAGTPSSCVTPEPSPSGYSLFRANRRVLCSDGSRVPVGVITMDALHADRGTRGRRPSWSDVIHHYEHTGTQLAHVAVYDDEWGVQCHGTLAPGVTMEQVRRAMASAPSVDLRNAGDGLDLAGVLMVNQPGWPVYEVEESEPYLLVASAAPMHSRHCEVRVASGALSASQHCTCHRDEPAAATPRLSHLRRWSNTRRRDDVFGVDTSRTDVVRSGTTTTRKEASPVFA